MLGLLKLIASLKIIFVNEDIDGNDLFRRFGIILRKNEDEEFSIGHIEPGANYLSLLDKIDFTLYKEGKEYILKVY